MRILAIFCTVFLLLIFTNSISAQTDDKVVVLNTSSGELVIEFFPNDAPNHVENFINLAENGFYDGVLFHRVIEGFMVQGGDPNTVSESRETWGQGGPAHSINAEFNNIKHNRGIVSMARTADPNSAGSQFFIVHNDSNFLDQQYTVFGRIATEESFQTLDKIATLETNPNDVPINLDAVKIIDAKVLDKSEVPNLLDLGEPERVSESTSQEFEAFSGTYSDEELGFSMDFPAGWNVQQIERTHPAFPNIAAVEPKSDGVPASISVLVEDSNGRSLDEFLDEWKELYLQSSINEGNLEIHSNEKTTINGLEAIISHVTGNVATQTGSLAVKYKEATINGDGKFYKVSYTALEEDFENNLATFENTLNTFSILNEKQSMDESIEDMSAQQPTDENMDGGGCLIATATFGSELSSQVQQLRETRDNILLTTESGTSFLNSFNQFYYSFSPTVADWERQNPIFKESVKVAITPLLTSLLILNYVEINSEAEMVGFGISLILLNAGMYFAAPAYIFFKLRK